MLLNNVLKLRVYICIYMYVYIYIYVFSAYLALNICNLEYKDQSVNGVQGKTCAICHNRGIHKYSYIGSRCFIHTYMYVNVN
jgi:hypothetical protein